MKTIAELLRRRAAAIEQMRAMLRAADERADAGMTEDEEGQYTDLEDEVGRLDAEIERRQRLTELMNDGQFDDDDDEEDGYEPVRHRDQRQRGNMRRQAPAHRGQRTKDTPDSIMCRYIRTGDESAAREMRAAALDEYRGREHDADYAEVQQAFREERASNDTIMNITTAADGANLVPVGHYNRIIARRDEIALRPNLGLMPVPGVGTTVDVPIDNEADGEFVLTGEQVDAHTNNFDRDAPAVGKVPMTLVKYTKKIELTDELLLDNDSNLMEFLELFVGRGLAKTDNNLIVTEALADGTAALTLDGATIIGAAEIPELIYTQAEGYEDGSVWVMRRATEGHIRGKTGDNWQFVPTPAGGRGSLWNFPVYTTSKMPAIGGGNKSILFGNFAYMGVRQMPGLTLLRDPYSVDGMVVLKYYYRVDYEVLQPAAIVYATAPTA